MKENILKQMISIVDETMESCKSDFYKWDLKALTNMHEEHEFMWCVRRGGTTLLAMNEDDEKRKLSESETYRFSFMHSPSCYIHNFAQYAKWSGSRTFFYDGAGLIELAADQVDEYLERYFERLVDELVRYVDVYFAAEDGDYDKKVDLHFTSAAFDDVLTIARTDEGAELLKCLHRFRHYTRAAKSHKITIGLDFTDKSFTFSEVINGKHNMCGGIIYDHGKWNIYT